MRHSPKKQYRVILPTLALPTSGSRVEAGLLPLSLLQQAPLNINYRYYITDQEEVGGVRPTHLTYSHISHN